MQDIKRAALNTNKKYFHERAATLYMYIFILFSEQQTLLGLSQHLHSDVMQEDFIISPYFQTLLQIG